MLRIVRALAILVALAAAPAMAQDNWPEKPVKLVVGFTAGSATDVTARMFAEKFQKAWGNRWSLRTSPAIRAPSAPTASPRPPRRLHADVGGNAAITILPSLQTLPFDPLKDLTPISTRCACPRS
jgi:tripartite-type tricarboxylate transporter receptor subunit TctC